MLEQDITEGVVYVSDEADARWPRVKVDRIWTAEDGHTGVGFDILGEHNTSSAMPAARFAERYRPEAPEALPVETVPAAPMSFEELAYWLHELGTPEEALERGVSVASIIARARLAVEAFERAGELEEPEDTGDRDEDAWLAAQDRR